MYYPRMDLSELTVSILIDQASEWGHSPLTTLLMRSGFGAQDPGRAVNRATRAESALKHAHATGDTRGLLDLARSLLNSHHPPTPDTGWVRDLADSLRRDGYLLTGKASETQDHTSWSKPAPVYRWTIEPVGGDEVPLVPQVGAVQQSLIDRGLVIAAKHFEQAFRAYSVGDLEAANGQLRPALESVLTSIAQARTSWRGLGGGAAIDAINNAGLFEKGEYDYIYGLWRMSHKNGSHPGLSNADEALFRISSVTALLQFLTHRFP